MPTTSAPTTRIPTDACDDIKRRTGLTPEQADTVLQLICLPENGERSWWKHYNYIEKLGDGRGYTATIFGACSGTGDLLMIFDQLAKIDPKHPLLKYHANLKKCTRENVHGIEGLLHDLPKLGDDRAWQTAVWRVYLDLYWDFAARFAAKQKECAKRPGPVLSTALAKGFMVDTAINHGADLESFDHVVKRMRHASCDSEKEWLMDFMKTRKDMLKSGFQLLDTSKTGDRCKLWLKVLKEGNDGLSRPIRAYAGYWGDGIVVE